MRSCVTNPAKMCMVGCDDVAVGDCCAVVTLSSACSACVPSTMGTGNDICTNIRAELYEKYVCCGPRFSLLCMRWVRARVAGRGPVCCQ